MNTEKRKELKFVWAPTSTDGRIVSVIEWHDDIVIACEFAIYRMKTGPDDNAAPIVEGLA